MWFRMNLACRPVPHWLVRITLDSKVAIEQNPAKKKSGKAKFTSGFCDNQLYVFLHISTISQQCHIVSPIDYPSHIPVMYTHPSYIYIVCILYRRYIYNISLKTTRIHIILLCPLYYTIPICISGWILIVHPPEGFTKGLVQWRRSELTGLVHPGFYYIICKYVNMFFPIYSISIYIYYIPIYHHFRW
jgi:hypothetical protein